MDIESPVFNPHVQNEWGKVIVIGGYIIGERAKRVSYSQVCSIEIRNTYIYVYVIVISSCNYFIACFIY